MINLKEVPEFFKMIDTEEKAEEWVWHAKFGETGFKCRVCGAAQFYRHKSKPEIRTCTQCLKQTRLRTGTLFEHSKIPILKWLLALYLLMEAKGAMSALELMRTLEIKSYQTAWRMFQKIKKALQEGDWSYDSKLRQIIRSKGTTASSSKMEDQKSAWLPLESPEMKPWVPQLLSDVKTWIRTHHGIQSDILSRYLSRSLSRLDQQLQDPDWILNRDLMECITGLKRSPNGKEAVAS